MALELTDFLAIGRSGFASTFKATVQELINLGNTISARTYLLTNSGRFKLDKFKWTTTSNFDRGENDPDFTQNCGTNAEPTYQWDHIGQVIPKGHKLHKLFFTAVASNNKILDFEIRIVARYANPVSNWETGINSNTEMTIDEIYSGSFHDIGTSGNLNTLRKRVFNLANYEMQEDGFLSIYVRNTQNKKGNLATSWSFELIGRLV